jgi:hypothetical protein
MDCVGLDVLVGHGFEMSSIEDEHPVQTFTPDGADELSEGVRTGRTDRSTGGPNALGTRTTAWTVRAGILR